CSASPHARCARVLHWKEAGRQSCISTTASHTCRDPHRSQCGSVACPGEGRYFCYRPAHERKTARCAWRRRKCSSCPLRSASCLRHMCGWGRKCGAEQGIAGKEGQGGL